MQKYETIHSALIIPLTQAVATGVLGGAASVGAAYLLQFPSPWLVGASTAPILGFASWLIFRSQWAERLEGRRRAEEEKKEYRSSVRVEVVSNEGKEADWINLNIDRARLLEFAAAMAAGEPLTFRRWAGGKCLFSGAEYATLIASLERRGLVRQKSPHDARAGFELSARGRAVFRGLADPSSNPPTLNGLVVVRSPGADHAHTITQPENAE